MSDFRVRNITARPLVASAAHEGRGHVNALRVATRAADDCACEFIDYAEVPPGSSIGDHRHPADEEEYYLVLSGSGRLRLDDEVTTVTAGDLIRNRGGGLHGLANTGDQVLRLFIFAVTRGRS